MENKMKAIVAGGLAAAVLDALDAVVAYKLAYGMTPLAIYQFVASGMLGQAAYAGGAATALAGLAIHFLIAFTAAAVFVLAVSLAIALSLPTTLPSGAPFPFRAEILFIAFVTVVVTLLGQGLTLPPLIRLLGVKDDGRVDRETRAAQLAVAKAGAVKADALLDAGLVPRHRVERLRDPLRERHQHLESHEKPGAGHGDGYRRVVREILQEQRAEILRLRDAGEIGDDAMRAVERDLDLEEARRST